MQNILLINLCGMKPDWVSGPGKLYSYWEKEAYPIIGTVQGTARDIHALHHNLILAVNDLRCNILIQHQTYKESKAG